jgi:preprotein translocase subunit SecG
MLILKIFLIIVEVICSLLLIGVILLQRAKGEGLGLAFGAQMGESLFGARASNVLVKVTIWLGVIFLVCTTLLARMYAHGYGSTLMERQAPVQQKAMPVNNPIAPAPASFPAAPPTMPDAQLPPPAPMPNAGE